MTYVNRFNTTRSSAEFSKERITKKALCKSLSAPVMSLHGRMTSQYRMLPKQSTPRKLLRVQPTTYEVERTNELKDLDIGKSVNKYWENEKNGCSIAIKHLRNIEGL